MMKKLFKFSLWKILCCLSLVIGLGISEAGATCGDPGKVCPDYFQLHQVERKGTDAKAPNDMKQYYNNLKSLKSQIEALCKKGDEQISYIFCITSEELVEGMQKANVFQKYKDLQRQFTEIHKKMVDYRDPNNCGTLHPYGCPEGQNCYVQKSNVSITRGGMNTHSIDVESVEPVCLSGTPDMSKYDQAHFNTTQSVIKEAVDDKDKTVDTKTTALFSTGLGTHSTVDPDGNVTMDLTYAGGTLVEDIGNYSRTNEVCHIDQLKDRYMGTCYSCVVVSALISTFMKVAATVEPLMQSAGVKLLLIGMMIWLPIYILGKLSSFVSLEPMKILQELFTFFFKCLLAYTIITSGLKTISTLIVNPLLIAGADYGIAIIDTVMPEKLNIDGVSEDNRSYQIASTNSIDRKVFDRIMTISKKADAAVSLNFVIGDALFCHSYHAGSISFKIPITETTSVPFYFPDFWLMACGAVIWFFAFMVTMGVNFYLLDLSFKIGFALMALPVTLGLWPFNKFKNKFADCVKIIVNAAGTFMFLGITTGISIVLISSALGGTDELLKQINANNQEYVSQLFSLTGSSFLIILFAFFYSHNLISATVSKMVDKFFSSVMSGMSPMHQMTTQMIDFVKKQIGNAASIAAGGVGGMVANSAKGAATKAVRGAIDKMRGGGKDDGGSDGGGFSEE